MSWDPDGHRRRTVITELRAGHQAQPIPVVIDIDSVDGASVNAERMRTVLINAISGSREFRYLANPALTGETNYLKWYWLTLRSVASSGPEAATAFGGALTYHAPSAAYLGASPARVTLNRFRVEHGSALQ